MPLTVSEPPATVVVPPEAHCVDDQPDGSVVPANSPPSVGASMTSPLLVCDTTPPAPTEPAEKSATVVSSRLLAAVNVQTLSLPSALPAASVIVPATVT